MSEYFHGGADGRSLELLLIVVLAVGLASSAAWLLARRLWRHPALRHLIAFAALMTCLAIPAAAWTCARAGVAVLSIPILPGEQSHTTARPVEREGDLERLARCLPADWSPVAGGPSATTRAATTRPGAASAPVRASRSPSSPATLTLVACCDSTASPVAKASDVTAPVALPTGPRRRSAAESQAFQNMGDAALAIWAAGAVVMLLRLACNAWRVIQLRRAAFPIANGRIRALFAEVTGQLAPHRPPLLLVSSRAVTPLAVGFGRPAVILPERLLGILSENELRDILIHELAHLRRGDQRIMLLQELAAALYWPIVPIHALNRELQRAREELCDNVVIAGRDPLIYGETLLHVAELLVGNRRMEAAIGFVGAQGELERRISGLIDPARNTRTTTGRKATCVVMLLFAAAGATLSALRFAPSAAAAERSVAGQETAPAAQSDAVRADLPAFGCPEPGAAQDDAAAADPQADEKQENPEPATNPVNQRAAVTKQLSAELRRAAEHDAQVRTDPYFSSIGGLVQSRGWKKILPLAPVQTESILKLEGLLWDARWQSLRADADYLAQNPADYREYLDRSHARRTDALDHAQCMIALGLLTEEQAALVAQRRLPPRRQQVFNAVRYRLRVQELLGISQGQLDLLNQVGADARQQRARLNWFSADPEESQHVTAESTRIERESFGALEQILTPRQRQILEQLMAERTLPAEPPDVRRPSAVEAERIDIEELSPTFRALAEQADVLGLSADQRKWLAELKDVARTGLFHISVEKREGPYLPGDPRNDKTDPIGQTRAAFLRHVEQIALVGILTQQQAARLIVEL